MGLGMRLGLGLELGLGQMGLILAAVMHEFKAVHGMPPVHLAPGTWADTKRLLQATGMTVQMGWWRVAQHALTLKIAASQANFEQV